MKQSEALLASVVKSTNNVAFDIRLAVHFIQDQVYSKNKDSGGGQKI